MKPDTDARSWPTLCLRTASSGSRKDFFTRTWWRLTSTSSCGTRTSRLALKAAGPASTPRPTWACATSTSWRSRRCANSLWHLLFCFVADRRSGRCQLQPLLLSLHVMTAGPGRRHVGQLAHHSAPTRPAPPPRGPPGRQLRPAARLRLPGQLNRAALRAVRGGHGAGDRRGGLALRVAADSE